jgi:putative phage-type endonuclease
MVASTSIVSVKQALGPGLGSSQAAAALGLSPWCPPITLWLDLTGRQPIVVDPEKTGWGTKLEPVIRAEYVERHGVEVRVPRSSSYHPAIPWLRDTTDGIVYVPTSPTEVEPSHILECKNVGWRLQHHWLSGDEITVPPYYVCQAVVHMAVTGLRRVDWAVLIGGNSYHEATLEHDAELEQEVLEGLAEFWALVQSDTPPDVDASNAYTDYLKDKIARSEAVVTATPRAERSAEAWRECERQLKDLTEQRNQFKNEVLAEMVGCGAAKMRTEFGIVSVTVNDDGKRTIRRPNHWTGDL